ncbi:MAG: CHASE2 domain-containing protein, partial [Acidobacteria bacterium]|nr:CHASE2 domain-containing protein [Acidobacteriota bacterium]
DRPWPRQLPYLLLTASAALLALFLGWTAYAERINHNFYDLYFPQRGPRPSPDGIVIVAIDDATLARYGALPLSRSVLAQAIHKIQQANPRLLAVDLLFSEPSEPEADAELAEALAGPTPVVLASALEIAAEARWLKPLPQFARFAALGHAHADPDSDGVNRRVLLAKQAGQERYWALVLECYRMLRSPSPAPVLETEDALVIAGNPATEYRIPASRRDQRALLINYAGGNEAFPTLSLAAVLNGSLEPQLKDKVVLLGVTAQGVGDRLFTPYSSGIGMAGVEIHANILHTLLTEDFLQPASNAAVALAVVLIALLSAFALARLHGLRLTLALAALAVAVMGIPYWLFLHGAVWPAFSLLLPLGTAVVFCGAYQLLSARRSWAESEARRERSRQQFEMAAHEMRTPLTAIQGSSELLQRYALDDSKREQMLRLIGEESQRLGKLVERFLRVERLSAGEMELQRAPVDLSALLGSVAERLRPAAERKGIQLTWEHSGPEAEITADKELLEFAISNLLSNAVKYSPPGSAVRLVMERSGRQVQVHVVDNGPGLTAEESRRIFDRFYRTESARRSDAPGFGLGLNIAREIAAHHGGELRVDSAPGAGSRFTICLPIEIAVKPS